jgi:hypothetical protein
MYISDLFLLLPSCYGEIFGCLWPYKPSIYCRLAVGTDMGDICCPINPMGHSSAFP